MVADPTSHYFCYDIANRLNEQLTFDTRILPRLRTPIAKFPGAPDRQ